MHFRTFRLQPPHAPPLPGDTSCSGRAWPTTRFCSLSSVLRTSHIPSSLISRIRPYRVCVAGSAKSPFSSTDYPFTSSCSPPRVATTQLLSVPGGKHRQRGTFTLQCTPAPKRTRPGPLTGRFWKYDGKGPRIFPPAEPDPRDWRPQAARAH